ncbi:bis(5'-nucleosyl)-tetraphosphatase PrpE [asymmetrical]-like [Centruroides vittatus]|uniref:bis(5'-nucleosyl)-tetraphosphatase PrpE [asymmetrical]-like n=1 Tax=Centruroides vittatus TaxID=120091 RepID=UPI00351006D2
MILKKNKMGALVSYVLSLYYGKKVQLQFPHAFGLKYPPVLHQTITQESIKKFNEVFVIGDVHGCYDEMMELLQNANALHDSTLKIFVGDIVNKGPKNLEVLTTLRTMTSSLIVRGNHDEVVLREYNKLNDPSYVIPPRNLWIKDIPKIDIDFLNNLPYTLSIPSLNVIIVHAGLVPNLPLHCHHPRDLVTMRNLKLGDYYGSKLEPTSKNTGEPWASLWTGPEHVYFGHDAKRMLQQYPHATGIDTGCVYGNHLTGIFISGARCGKLLSVKAKKVYEAPSGK